jgi:hypothetical protein
MKFYSQHPLCLELFSSVLLLSSSLDVSIDRRIVIATRRLRVCRIVRFGLLLVLLVDVLSTCRGLPILKVACRY